jgi:hypothetical protein
MRKFVAVMLGLLLAVPFATDASAKKGKKHKGPKGPQAVCYSQPTGAWVSPQQAGERARALGYAVWRIDHKRGCWEVHGTDKNGAAIRISFDPGTGQVARPGPRF